MRLLLMLILVPSFLMLHASSFACDGLSATVGSNVYIGNGEYLLTVEVCEAVTNSDGVNQASIHGVIVTVNGANVISVVTPSITGITQGVTANGTQIAANQVEYGDWGNPGAPIILDYGDPQECWTIQFIVDNAAVTIDVLTSSFNGPTQPGAGMNQVNGIWTCGNGVAVPPATCNSDWTVPFVCEGSTTQIDLNTTTLNTGMFVGPGVDSLTGIFDPTGLSGSVSIEFIVGDAQFNCSTTHDIIFTPTVTSNETINLCPGADYTYPDGTSVTNVQTDQNHQSVLSSVITGCDSIITTELTVSITPLETVTVEICSGSDYTYPDGTVSTNITTSETQTSNLQSVNGCDSVVVTNVNVQVIPTINIDESICQGSDYTYPDGTVSTNILTAESHASTLANVSGCDSIVMVNLTIIPPLASDEVIAICPGDNFTYADGTVSTNIQSDESHISTISSVNGCDSVVTTNLVVITPVLADFELNIDNSCIPAEVVATDLTQGNTVNCSWDFGNGQSSTQCGNQVITYDASGVYVIQLAVDNGCELDSISHIFTGEDCDIYIPNIISLQSNSGNDVWYVTAEGLESFHCLILNRWGNVITELNDIQETWDGTDKSGQLVSEGTYYYKIDLTYNNGEEGIKHGFIQVVH